jgi:hypothetical protein
MAPLVARLFGVDPPIAGGRPFETALLEPARWRPAGSRGGRSSLFAARSGQRQGGKRGGKMA